VKTGNFPTKKMTGHTVRTVLYGRKGHAGLE
jgi:hypothetical protein